MMKEICDMSETKGNNIGLFEIPAGSPAILAPGKLLVAEPFSDESYFSHAVVSLIDYDAAGGAMGVVLNNLTDSKLSEMLDDMPVHVDVPVFCGGPLALNRLFFLHTLGDSIIPRARQYMPGVYVGGDFEAMLDYINSGYEVEGVVRFFVGYSGWEEGQLESEIAGGCWAVGDAPERVAELLCGSGDAFWHKAVKNLGATYRAWRLVPRSVFVN